jgi:hypothetical protein
MGMRQVMPVNWTSGIAWLIAFVNVALGYYLLDGIFDEHPANVGTTWRNIFSGTLFIIICVPLLITAVVLGIVGMRRGETFGVASILFNLLLSAFVIYFQVIDPLFLDTPERRLRNDRAAARVRHESAWKRANGDITISKDSFPYKLVTYRWWLPVCIGTLCAGIALRTAANKSARATAITSESADATPSLTIIRCPNCKADVTAIVASGLSRCKGCQVELVGSRSSAEEAGERWAPLHFLLFEGSSVGRMIALLGVIVWVGLALTWIGLLLAGQWIASKRVAMAILYVTCCLGTLLALRVRRT